MRVQNTVKRMDLHYFDTYGGSLRLSGGFLALQAIHCPHWSCWRQPWHQQPRKDDMSRDPDLPGAPARPQDQLRWECDSPGTISTRCDEPLDTRVYIGLESTLGPLTLARTDKLSLFVVRACLRECERHRFWLCTAISGASGRNLPVVSARQFGLSSRRTALPLKHPEGHFWSTLGTRSR